MVCLCSIRNQWQRPSFHGNLLLMQRGKSISGAVSDGQYGNICSNLPFSIDFNGLQMSIFYNQLGNLLFKPHFSTGLLNGLPHRFHHLFQTIGSNMGFGLIKNILRRAKTYKGFQHLAGSEYL